jgi:hypothetical protein
MSFKAYDLKITVNGKEYEFYLNNKTHRWIISGYGKEFDFSKAKGQAIIDFLQGIQS